VVFCLNLLATAIDTFRGYRLYNLITHKDSLLAHFFCITVIKLITRVIIVSPLILFLVLLFNKSIKLIKS